MNVAISLSCNLKDIEYPHHMAQARGFSVFEITNWDEKAVSSMSKTHDKVEAFLLVVELTWILDDNNLIILCILTTGDSQL